MAEAQFDLDRIVSVLRDATMTGALFSQRSLSKAAGEGRDCVGDIINGRNRNPTSKVLANLAHAMGGDLSLFGLTTSRADPPTEAELHAALLEALPDMPRGGRDKRAAYLAQAVAQTLRLPPDRPANDRDGRRPDVPEGDVPPPEATT